MDRRQMTLMLSDKEMSLLDQLADRRGMSKTALVRQALRLYQSVTERIENGEKVFVEHPDTKDKAELMERDSHNLWRGMFYAGLITACGTLILAFVLGVI